MGRILNSDPIELLGLVNTKIEALASKMHLKSLLLYLAVILVAAIIGLAGMHLAKVLSMLSLGAVGYVAGYQLFTYLHTFAWCAKAPLYVGYIVGVVVAALFYVLGWKKCLFVMFGAFAVAGFILTKSYLTPSTAVAVGGAVLLAMLSVIIMKIAFITLTSAVGSFAIVNFLGALLPKVSFLQLSTSKVAVWIAVGLTVVFMLVQFVTTRRYNLNGRAD